MLAIERRNEILEKLQTDRRVVVSELSQLYDVSEETIRRDLEKLVNDGYAIKSYGGAVINENVNIELPFNIRKNRNILGKQHIAELVAGLVNDGDSIMLDASTTAVYIAKALQEKGKKNLTIITNSIEIIIELFDVQDWTILSTGGASREGSFALVGPQTDRMLSNYHVDKAHLWDRRQTGCSATTMLIKQLSPVKALMYRQDLRIQMICMPIIREQCSSRQRTESLRLTAVNLTG